MKRALSPSLLEWSGPSSPSTAGCPPRTRLSEGSRRRDEAKVRPPLRKLPPPEDMGLPPSRVAHSKTPPVKIESGFWKTFTVCERFPDFIMADLQVCRSAAGTQATAAGAGFWKTFTTRLERCPTGARRAAVVNRSLIPTLIPWWNTPLTRKQATLPLPPPLTRTARPLRREGFGSRTRTSGVPRVAF